MTVALRLALAGLLAASVPTQIQAQVYKWTDAQGGVVYGNNPDEHLNAEPVRLGEPSIYSTTEPSVTQVQVKKLYRLNFIRPAEGENVHSPAGEVLVEVELSPPDKRAQSYQYFLDDNLVAEDPAPRIRLQGLAPGSYALRVRAVDRAKKLLVETEKRQLQMMAPKSPSAQP